MASDSPPSRGSATPPMLANEVISLPGEKGGCRDRGRSAAEATDCSRAESKGGVLGRGDWRAIIKQRNLHPMPSMRHGTTCQPSDHHDPSNRYFSCKQTPNQSLGCRKIRVRGCTLGVSCVAAMHEGGKEVVATFGHSPGSIRKVEDRVSCDPRCTRRKRQGVDELLEANHAVERLIGSLARLKEAYYPSLPSDKHQSVGLPLRQVWRWRS